MSRLINQPSIPSAIPFCESDATMADEQPQESSGDHGLTRDMERIRLADDFPASSADEESDDDVSADDSSSPADEESSVEGRAVFCGYSDGGCESDSDAEGNPRKDRVEGRVYRNYGTGEIYMFDECRKAAESGVAKHFGVNSAFEVSRRLVELEKHEYFKFAADQGDAAAQLRLSQLYLHGDDVERDIDKGIHYLELAAEQGNGMALANLGYICMEGFGSKPDLNKARQYLEEALEQGCAVAQIMLDDLNSRERGVQQGDEENQDGGADRDDGSA